MRTSLDRQDIKELEVCDLYSAIGFGTMVAEGLIGRIFPQGVYPIVAFNDSNKLVGLVRIFSDDNICSWIAEIAVYPSNESTAIVRKMFETAVERFGHTAIFSEVFESEVELLKEFGITPKPKLTAVSRAPSFQSPPEPQAYIH